ncbi:MAG: hypothetical protein FWH50_00970, partial [Coriobacteriia bacterium]|nr:hypothetical protein [Coriobacteriia bacterium]
MMCYYTSNILKLKLRLKLKPDPLPHPQAKLDQRGQATVEAAFMIPIIFLLLLMLIQPAIL